MKQKHKNKTKSLYLQLARALWNIKISCRYHSTDTQQKPTQSKKFKIICFASSNMENWTRWDTSFVWCHKNVYPLISIDKAIDVILQQLIQDYEDLKTRTKLTLVDIQQLIELCVSECYFLWDNVIWNLLNLGPWSLIGLSIMVALSESYSQNLVAKTCRR